MKLILAVFLLPFFAFGAAQSDSTLASYQAQDVVISATKTERKISDLSVPLILISAKEIANTGAVRLDQLLAMQTGLAITTDNSNGGHGSGIQIQGFDPAYIMILVDGEPLIGRTAGTLDLSRITLNNVERIEVLKGAASCLYGSEAMGGVINIITKKPKKGLNNTIYARHGNFGRLDFTDELTFRNNRWSLYSFLNRYSSEGYRLTKSDSLAPTAPPFNSYSGQVKIKYFGSAKWEQSFSTRFLNEKQFSSYTKTGTTYTDNAATQEYSFAPVLSYKPSNKTKLDLKGYGTLYQNNSLTEYVVEPGASAIQDFLQQLYKAEAQLEQELTSRVRLFSGVGGTLESVEATRYQNKKQNSTVYAYFQTEEQLSKRFLLTTGLRYDRNTLYGDRLSPKISGNYKIGSYGNIKASYGTGFKAPDFRQVYLTFTNPKEGYSVFGTEEVASQMAQLDSSGQIKTTLIPVTAVQALKAEYSTAYNLGYSLNLFDRFSFDLNFFYNRVHNLIETRAIAIKTNNSNVFSYFNLNDIYTRGIEVSAGYTLTKNLKLKGGYQFLEAKDLAKLKLIDEHKVLTRNANGDEFYVERENYFGLANRSRHSGNLAFNFQNTKDTWEGSIRCIYKGRYGFADNDGNSIINKVSETVSPYYLLNASLTTYFFAKKLTAQVTLDNILNYTNPVYIPGLPGRMILVGLTYQFALLKKYTNNE